MKFISINMGQPDETKPLVNNNTSTEAPKSTKDKIIDAIKPPPCMCYSPCSF